VGVYALILRVAPLPKEKMPQMSKAQHERLLWGGKVRKVWPLQLEVPLPRQGACQIDVHALCVRCAFDVRENGGCQGACTHIDFKGHATGLEMTEVVF
jgi:hypothetical protein